MLVGVEAGLRVLRVDHADDALLVHDRHRELRAARLVVDDVARVVAHVVDALGLSRVRDRADDAVADRDLDGVDDGLAFGALGAEGGPLHEDLALLVEQVDHTVLEAQARDGVPRDQPQQLVDGVPAKDLDRELADDVEIVGLPAERLVGVAGRNELGRRAGHRDCRLGPPT